MSTSESRISSYRLWGMRHGAHRCRPTTIRCLSPCGQSLGKMSKGRLASSKAVVSASTVSCLPGHHLLSLSKRRSPGPGGGGGGGCLVAESCLTLCNSMDCIVHQTPLSTELSGQEYWSGLPFPSPDLPHPGIEPTTPALAGGFFITEPPGKPPQALLRPVLRISLGISSSLLAEDQCTSWRSRQARRSHPRHGRTAGVCTSANGEGPPPDPGSPGATPTSTTYLVNVPLSEPLCPQLKSGAGGLPPQSRGEN